MIHRPALTPIRLILIAALFLAITGNIEFFNQLIRVYPLAQGNIGFVLSVAILLCSSLGLLVVVLAVVVPVRPLVSLLVLLGAATAYYTDQFGTVIDTVMIRNVLQTDMGESADLLSPGFFIRFVCLGVIPVVLLWRWPFSRANRLKELRYSVQTAFALFLVMLLCVFPFGDQYASFFREHKSLRYYSNPGYPLYSMIKYAAQAIQTPKVTGLVQLVTHATIAEEDDERELIIMVVGETARADHFSLNGYTRTTNPRLAVEKNLVSYSDITACGTSTAISVPCMFAFGDHQGFDVDEADRTQNILDVLAMAGVNILWRDNNSSSKGVANRTTVQDFRTPENNPVCDDECRDEGMLYGLQAYINAQAGDILIVLHQMGSHGPAYYKRYPAAFEQFSPACQSAELAECTTEEIINAYDNTILYTDYFLSKVIALLKANTPRFETAMLYVSDHGESLGEKGLYLHGMPYWVAPDAQLKVPVLIWVGESSDIDFPAAEHWRAVKYSHDAVVPSLISAFEIESDLDSAGASAPLYEVQEGDAD